MGGVAKVWSITMFVLLLDRIFNLSVSCPGEPCGEAHMAAFRSRSSEASNSHTSELQVAI